MMTRKRCKINFQKIASLRANDIFRNRSIRSSISLFDSACPLSARRTKSHRARTAAGLLEVVAAISELETSVIAVTRFIAGTLDNRVRRLLLYNATRIPALAAKLRGPATSGSGDVRQGNQRDDDQPGQRHVLPPHSPRDSATVTRPCSPLATTIPGCLVPHTRGNTHARAATALLRDPETRARHYYGVSRYKISLVLFFLFF